MTMRGEIINELMNEYQAIRARNTEIEAQRLAQASSACPEIGDLVRTRQELIFSGVRMALDGKAMADMPKQMEVYSKRIRALLKSIHMPEDYLQPVYNCATCHDTGYTGDNVREMCDCLKKKYYQKLYHEIGLNEQMPQTFHTFDNAVFSDEVIVGLEASQRDVAMLNMETALKYADSFPNNAKPDLLFIGKSGVGKTFLMHAIAHMVLERGYSALCISAYQLIAIAREAHYHNGSTELQSLFDVSLLLIDDLGTEPMMENVTLPYLYNLINERQQKGKHTVITTNLSKTELKERYTERIASRLLNPNQCEVMAFVGEDVRKRRRV